jgi:hypothetical protein
LLKGSRSSRLGGSGGRVPGGAQVDSSTTAMLEETGPDGDTARLRAKIVGWAFRGSAGADEAERLRAFRDLTEILLHDAN